MGECPPAASCQRPQHTPLRATSPSGPVDAANKLTPAFRLPVPAQNSNYLENGRYYHGYRRGMYQYPCDEVGALSPALPPPAILTRCVC